MTTPAEIVSDVEGHIVAYVRLCKVLGMDPMGYDSGQAQTRAADEIERLRAVCAASADQLTASYMHLPRDQFPRSTPDDN
jgi:hypothetical protein